VLGFFDLQSFVMLEKIFVVCIFRSNFLHFLVDICIEVVELFSGQKDTFIKRLKLFCTEIVFFYLFYYFNFLLLLRTEIYFFDWFYFFDFFKLSHHHTKTLFEGEFLVFEVFASVGIFFSRHKIRIHFIFDCVERLLFPFTSCLISGDSLVVK
jgi:hypothetical protein